MKMDRKLKRGLADLSKLFSEPSFPEKKSEGHALMIEPPEADLSSEPPPQIINVSFLDAFGRFEPLRFLELTDAVKSVFQEAYLLTVASDQDRYGEFSKALSSAVAQEHGSNGGFQLYSVNERMAFGCLPQAQLNTLIHPKEVFSSSFDIPNSEKALVVLDAVSVNPGEGLIHDCGILEILDHCVFQVSADPDHVLKTYELMRFCLLANPMLNTSILVVGPNAQKCWELVYERLNEITSQFLGCNLGFLGWVNNEQMRLYPELLLEEGRAPTQRSAKIRLSELLYSPVPISS